VTAVAARQTTWAADARNHSLSVADCGQTQVDVTARCIEIDILVDRGRNLADSYRNCSGVACRLRRKNFSKIIAWTLK